MITGIISFCDRVAFNIKSNEIKDMILEELDQKFSIKIIQKHYYTLNELSIKHIIATQHVVTIRSNGNPYLVFFTKYEGEDIIFLIDRKIHPTYSHPRIIIGRGLYNKELFEGTLIDGEMLKMDNGKWIFLINDIIGYKGIHLIKKQLPERLSILYNMLEIEYNTDTTMDMYQYKIKQYYNLCTDTLNKIIHEKYPYSIRGIYIWAYNLKYKPKLMNIDNSVIKNVIIKTKEIPNFIENKIIPEKIIEKIIEIKNDDDILEYHILILSQTDLPDIYKITNDKNENLGNACIQNIKISHIIRNEFKDIGINITKKFKCKFNKKWNKWEPINVIS